MFSILVPLLVLTVAGAAGCVVAVRLGRLGRIQDSTLRERNAAAEAEAMALRRMRLVAHDLRSLGMRLHGHADQLTVTDTAQADGIATAAADLLDMADELQDRVQSGGMQRMLQDEQIGLTGAVEDAVAAVAASLLPGRRNWRVAADMHGIILRADRRALRHVLTRVLADAVRSTRLDDWIDISVRSLPDGLALVIADEGAGTNSPAAGIAPPRDSRGIGLRLALARTLMEAHEGSMEIEAHSGVGTSVSLVFPQARLRGSLSPPSRSYAAPMPAAGDGDR